MASRKRARTSSTGGASSSSATAPTITLSGGEACPTKQVALWRSGRLTDTTVEVDGRTFAAHRLVIAAACDYFERHYDHEHMRDADHPKLLEHVTAAAFEPLLGFLYEGACTFDESLLAPVLRAAHYLGVTPLERAAVSALSERISPSNALAAWTWGEELELPELSEAAKVTALQNFDELEKIEEATLAQVQSLVADDRLTAKSEEAVFSAVARFAEAKQPAEADLLGLLRDVRFAQMSRPFILETVRSSPMLQSGAGKDLLLEMTLPLANGPAQQPRVGFGGRFLYVMGGRKVGSVVSTAEVYEILTNTWTSGTPMPKPVVLAAAAMLGGKIYVLGGAISDRVDGDNDGVVADVHVFDPQTGAWTEAPPMRTARRSHAAAVVGGQLYVIGGDDDALRDLRCAEAFDPQTGAWTEVAPMHELRYATAAAVLDGKIYVTGGFNDGHGALNTVEVYDPQTNTWAMALPMKTARNSHGVAVLGGKIYVAGGNDNRRQPESSVEAFDPRTNSWQEVASMSTPRMNCSLTAVRGKLYAVGGGDASGRGALATVEAYDPQQNRWEAVAPMASPRRSHAAAL